MVEQFSVDYLTKEANQIQLLKQISLGAGSKGSQPIVLFGSGTIGKLYLKHIKTINPSMEVVFCDNSPSKWGTSVEGSPVISFNELKTHYRDSYIIITSLDYYDEISLQLKENHLNSVLDTGVHYALWDSGNILGLFENFVSLIQKNINQFQTVYSLLSDELSKQIFLDRINHCITASSKYLTPLKSEHPQYFDADIIKLSDEEIFIDGGAYIGDTVEEFMKQTNGKFNRIYAFEPEESKYKEFNQISKGHERIELLPYGLWSKREVLRFNSQNNYASNIDESGNTEIPVISIDEVLNGDPVTFIKMDIEGAELEALKGASTTIRKYKPILAICIYHKPLDIVEIPMYIKELVPEYKIYIRHYGVNLYETVCYAVAK